MKKMKRLSVSGNHSQLTILLCLVSFNLSRNFLKFRLNYIEKVKCPDGHLCLSLRSLLHPLSITQKYSGGTYLHSHTPFADR